MRRFPIRHRRNYSRAASQLRRVLLLALTLVVPSTGNKHTAAANGQQKAGQESKILEFRNTAPGVAYVGSKACLECHADIYSVYVKTDMGRSMS